MKFTTKYSKVESVEYEFDEADIKRALILLLESLPYSIRKEGNWVFDWFSDDESGKLTVRLVHKFEDEIQSEEKTEGDVGVSA